MCKFCEALKGNTNINVSVRSTYADDNFSECIQNNLGDIDEISSEFKMRGYTYKDDVFMSIEYHSLNSITTHHGGLRDDCNILTFSEGFQINFCPICGCKISDNVKKWEDYYSHIINIEEV